LFQQRCSTLEFGPRPSVMPQQIEPPVSTLEATYKARETEGVIDLHFFRPIGFRLAGFFAKMNMSPAGVTLLACLFGIIAGHLFFYRDLRTNVAGMALLVCANALDNADGQLARLTHRESREGRIVDSLADHLVFVSIYIHLTLRYLVAGASPAILLLALAAGISHALQGAAADYYRTTYLYFATSRSRMELDSSSLLRSNFRSLTWHREPWHKFLLLLYLNFTRQQEMLSPNLRKVREAGGGLFGGQIPIWLKSRYKSLAGPALKWWGLLMTNTRMLVLFALLVIGEPVWYFWFELIALNALFVYLIIRQKDMADSLLEVAVRWRDSP
jgi:phosphatidylglycerophosphate synthase